MIPLEKIKSLVAKPMNNLEKELSSGNIDKKDIC